MDLFLFVWHGLFLSIIHVIITCSLWFELLSFECHSCWYLLLLFYCLMFVVAMSHVSVE